MRGATLYMRERRGELGIVPVSAGLLDTNGDVRGYMNIDKFRNEDDITRFGSMMRASIRLTMAILFWRSSVTLNMIS